MNGLLPPAPFRGALVRRTALVWVGLHFAFALAILWDGGGGMRTPGAADAVRLHPLAVSWLLAGVVLAVHLDVVRQGEGIFLANLGYSRARLTGLVLLVAGVLEVALQAVAPTVLS